MLCVYIALSLMLIIAFCFVLYAYRTTTVPRICITILLLALSTSSLYQISNDRTGLAQWINSGKRHYLLLEQFEALGGINGMITKVKQRLIENPKDAEGWRVLGKLYEAKQDTRHAHEAFVKANALTE